MSTLAELDVLSVAKIPWVHGAGAPGKPFAAARYSHVTIFCRFGPPLDFFRFEN
jgi:hypothetical protein